MSTSSPYALSPHYISTYILHSRKYSPRGRAHIVSCNSLVCQARAGSRRRPPRFQARGVRQRLATYRMSAWHLVPPGTPSPCPCPLHPCPCWRCSAEASGRPIAREPHLRVTTETRSRRGRQRPALVRVIAPDPLSLCRLVMSKTHVLEWFYCSTSPSSLLPLNCRRSPSVQPNLSAPSGSREGSRDRGRSTWRLEKVRGR